MASKSSADLRECDASVQSETDSLILDYLVYNSMKSVLQHAEARPRAEPATRPEIVPHEELPFEVTNGLFMVNSFLDIFNALHATAELALSLRFRLRLLQFTTHFVYRHSMTNITPSKTAIATLREGNSRRAKSWLTNAGEGVFPAELIKWYGDLDDAEYHEGNGSANDAHMSLLALVDILPSFIELTASRSNQGEWPIGDAWLELAAAMMLQSVLEKCDESTHLGSEMFKEAFAWGFEGMEDVTSQAKESQTRSQHESQADHENGDNDVGANPMDLDESINTTENNASDVTANIVFCDLTDTPSESDSSLIQAQANHSWTRIRSKYLRQLLPEPTSESSLANSSDSTSSATQMHEATLLHLRKLAAAHPVATFDVTVLEFLSAMSESVAKPVLVQLELAADEDSLAEEEATPFEIDLDFERMQITGGEALELRELAAMLKR